MTDSNPAEPLPSPEEVAGWLEEESWDKVFAGVEVAESRPEDFSGILLERVERALDDASRGEGKADCKAFMAGLLLLARWKEPRALPLVLRWLSLPAGQVFSLGGDALMESGGRILASVGTGQVDGITELILDTRVDPICRAEGLVALGCLVAWGSWSRETAASHFETLIDRLWADEEDHVLSMAFHIGTDLQMTSLASRLERALAEDRVDAFEFEDEALPILKGELPPPEIMLSPEMTPPIESALNELGEIVLRCDVSEGDGLGASCEFEESLIEICAEVDPGDGASSPAGPASIGRNDPCPCGSGAKYKRCCGRA